MKRNYEELVKKIEQTYQSGVTLDDAEKNAALALMVAEELNNELKDADLDVRMRKAGYKAIVATVRATEIAKHDRKPAEGVLEDVVATDPTACESRDALDRAEVHKNYIEGRVPIANNSHVYFRGIARGRFE